MFLLRLQTLQRILKGWIFVQGNLNRSSLVFSMLYPRESKISRGRTERVSRWGEWVQRRCWKEIILPLMQSQNSARKRSSKKWKKIKVSGVQNSLKSQSKCLLKVNFLAMVQTRSNIFQSSLVSTKMARKRKEKLSI